MKLFNNITNYKNKDYIIYSLVLFFSIIIIISTKTTENKIFNNYFNSSIPISNEDIVSNPGNNLSLDLDYYNTFVGLPTKDLFEQLESSFWQVLEDNDTSTTYQNESGSTITIYYNDLNIIESINLLELEQ